MAIGTVLFMHMYTAASTHCSGYVIYALSSYLMRTHNGRL